MIDTLLGYPVIEVTAEEYGPSSFTLVNHGITNANVLAMYRDRQRARRFGTIRFTEEEWRDAFLKAMMKERERQPRAWGMTFWGWADG